MNYFIAHFTNSMLITNPFTFMLTFVMMVSISFAIDIVGSSTCKSAIVTYIIVSGITSVISIRVTVTIILVSTVVLEILSSVILILVNVLFRFCLAFSFAGNTD